MALGNVDQFRTMIEQSQAPLVLLPQDPSPDALASGYAMTRYLEGRGLETALAYTHTFDPAQNLDFLPKPKEIRHELKGLRDFVLIFNTSHNPIERVRTDRKDKELRIYLTPEKGGIDPRDFSFIPAETKYDCIFVLGARDKESLGRLYLENADVFFEIPIVNIDCHSNNERYAQTNLIDVTASSLSESLSHLLMTLQKERLPKDVAQCLLAGIITGTDSFQSSLTTPKAFEIAAFLIESGADQQEIIRHLYKTQPLHLLKLFGRILANLQLREKNSLVWAMITIEDFVQSRSEPKHLPAILEKVRSHYSSGKHFLLLFQKEKNSFSGIFRSCDTTMYERLLSELDGTVQGDYFVFQSQGAFTQNFIERIEGALEQ